MWWILPIHVTYILYMCMCMCKCMYNVYFSEAILIFFLHVFYALSKYILMMWILEALQIFAQCRNFNFKKKKKTLTQKYDVDGKRISLEKASKQANKKKVREVQQFFALSSYFRLKFHLHQWKKYILDTNLWRRKKLD